MMVLHDSYGRDARHEARRATEHVLVKSLNRARHPTVLVGWIRLFCLKSLIHPTVLVGWEMSEIFRGMNQTDPRAWGLWTQGLGRSRISMCKQYRVVFVARWARARAEPRFVFRL